MIKIKKFLIILMIILLVNPMSFAQIILAEGTLVDESFIEIENSDELAAIKDDFTESYVLTNDIDLKDTEWEPIEGEFTGTLIGNEFIIRNMPAKYSEDENYGLFTEVANLKNIDVEIEFVEEPQDEEKVVEETEVHQAEKEVIEEEREVPLIEREIVEVKSKEHQAVEKEFVEEEPEAPQVGKKQEETSIETYAIGQSVSVGNYNEFKAAIENEKITEIILTANISRGTGIGQGQADVKARELVIDGAGKYELHSNRLDAMIAMDGRGGDITFKNLKVSPTRGTTNNFILTAPNNGAEFNVTFENVINGRAATSTKGGLVNAENAHVVFKGINKYETSGEPTIINNAKSFTVQESKGELPTTEKLIPLDQKGPPKVIGTEFITQGKLYASKQKAKMHVKPSGTMALYGGKGSESAIELEGKESEILVQGRFMLGSERETTGTTNGLIKLLGENARFNVDNGFLGFSQTEGSILYMNSKGGQVNIKGKEAFAQFAIEKGNGDHDASIHFNQNDDYQLNVSEGARFIVKKSSGKSMGIRVGIGTGHQVNVSGGARFSIQNTGSGSPMNPSGENAANQALYFNGTLPEFNLEGDGSEVELIADNGAAMHMTGGGIINAAPGTSFIARGQTESEKQGIIDTGVIDDKANSVFTLDRPKFYDFRNDRPGGGYLFTVGKNAIMKGINTDVSLWEKGVNLDEEPSHRIPNVSYTLSGSDFGKISMIDDEDIPVDIGNEAAMKDYSRMSGNLATPKQVFINALYQPTDADQKIYVQASIDEGNFGTRDLYKDEAEIQITHKKLGETGTGKILAGMIQPRNQSAEKDSFKIYGKPTLIDKDKGMNGFGWAEIELPKGTYLEAGDTIEVTGGTLFNQNDDTAEGDPIPEENILADSLTVIDVTPPEPTVLEDLVLTDREYLKNRPQKLIGSLPTEIEEKELEVSVEVSDENENIKNVDGELTVKRDENKFEYVFKDKLEIGDEVRVFLSDNSVVALDNVLGDEKDLTIPNRPITHTSKGNINPKEEFIYHDKVFKAAPTVFVVGASGELIFKSAPDILHFDVKVKPYRETYFVDKEKLGQPLAIIDDRPAGTKKGWRLTAKMEEPLTAINDPKNTLKASLIYRDGGKDKILTNAYQVVKSHVHEKDDPNPTERWDLSSTWNEDGDGMFIEIEPGALKANYQGQVNWILEDVPDTAEEGEE